MNKEYYDQILECLEVLSPRKARRLRYLIQQELMGTDETQKNENSEKIWNFLYRLFLTCLTKESRNNFINANITINELSYTIRHKAQDGWVVNNLGAFCIEKDGYHTEIVGHVPREYGKGFILEERNPQTEQEKAHAKKEKDFYTKFNHHLAVLSGEMDYRETFLTYGYQIKDPRIPKEFVELLINALGLSRIQTENVLEDEDHNTK